MFSPGQRLLLRSGDFAQFVRPVFRLDGQGLQVALANGSTRLVNARDVLITDWSGVERRRAERRQGERRRIHLPFGPRLERRRLGERRKMDRRQFAVRKRAPRRSRRP